MNNTIIERLKWHKDSRRFGPLAHNLIHERENIATVQQIESGLWFWYAKDKSVSKTPTDLETAKKDAKRHARGMMEVAR